MLTLMVQVETLPLDDIFAQAESTEENVRWFSSVGGAFEAWNENFRGWSDFIDCTLPQETERAGELNIYARQAEFDLAALQKLRQEGPPAVVETATPIFEMVSLATKVLTQFSEALESQVDVERAFAEVIEGP